MRSALVIDDDPAVLGFIQAVLVHAGWTVALSHDGEEATRQLAAQTFDLVISDIYMPREDGFGVMRRVRSSHPETRIMLISTNNRSDFDVLAIGRKLGADAVIQKPLTPQAILAGVEACAARPTSRKRSREPVVIGAPVKG